MTLADERCEVCRAGMPHLSDEQCAQLAADIDPAWTLIGGHQRLERRLELDDFGAAMALAVRVGFVAEAEGHHPDLEVRWGQLRVMLYTHAADGLTRNDFVLAAKIDRLLGG